MGKYNWVKVNPPPFGNKMRGGRVIDIKPTEVKFNSRLGAWVFYLEGYAVCSRGAPYNGIIGVKLRRGIWHWQLDSSYL